MDNGSNATLNVYPNVEAVAEFKVLTSNYGAQYAAMVRHCRSRNKSGGTSFHGSGFEYLRNEFFNAKSWEEGADPTAKKALTRSMISAIPSADRLHSQPLQLGQEKDLFFWSQEWRRNKTPTTILQNVPSDAERGIVGGSQTSFGDFTDLCPGVDCRT